MTVVNSPARHSDETTKALDEVSRRLHNYKSKGFNIGYIEAREIVSEVKREHQVKEHNAK